MTTRDLVVRAIRTQQGDEIDVYAFFLYGSDLGRVAGISRIHRDEDSLKGFQRPEIRDHVKSITEFLDSGPVLFPNAIILALSNEVRFEASRGTKPAGLVEVGASGTLTLPVRSEGDQAAWIVDGQQRSLALSRAQDSRFPVPVIGFVSPDLKTHREQFILVNKVKPLSPRLINELLPEVQTLLPKDLAARKLPSELCNLLNRDSRSPFHRLIKQASSRKGSNPAAVVTDTQLIEAIRRNLKPPFGALSPYQRSDDAYDGDRMFETLVAYWSAVKTVFADAWGKPSTQSRLMHSTGIRAMGALMDPIMMRADSAPDPAAEIQRSLERLQPHCRWTDGVWADLDRRWDAIQQTAQDISRLSDHLIRLDRQLARSNGPGKAGVAR